MNINSNGKAGFIELYKVFPDEYTLVLGHSEPEIFHKFTEYEPSILYYWSYDVDSVPEDDGFQIDITGFKYLDILRKYCVFGIRNLTKGSTPMEIEIQKGLCMVVEVLIKDKITDDQVIRLNQSYKKLLDL